MTTTSTEPKLSDDSLTQWPPKAHIVRKKDMPVTEGTLAICGEKLMGIHLGRLTADMKACAQCTEIAKRELNQ